MRLSKAIQRLLSECQTKNRIIWRGRMPVYDELFFNWCRGNMRPYVRVVLKRDKAEVFMEVPSFSRPMDDKTKAEKQYFLARHYLPLNDDPAIDTWVIDAPVEKAETMALELWEIGLAFCRRAQISSPQFLQIT